MRRMHVLAGAATALLVLAVAGWLVLSPGWAIGLLRTQAQQQLGRALEVRGGASIEFTPRLAIRLDQAVLANPPGHDGSFITARSIRIPVSLAGLLTRHADLANLELDGAEFAFLINERNEVSWAFAAVKTPAPLTLDITNGAMRFYDIRTAQAFSLSGARLLVTIGTEGDVAASGTADIGGRLARIDAKLKSLARVNDDGSPFDLTAEVPDGMASFSGRLSTASLLNFAGPVTITSPGLKAAARWAGLRVEQGDSDLAVSISGALESAGRAFAIRRAGVRYGPVEAMGDVVLDLRGEVPKLQAALATGALPLDPFLPESGRGPGQWGTRTIDFAALKAFDADMTIEAAAVSHGATTVGPGRAVVALAGGKLKSSLSLPSIGQGRFLAETAVDSSAIPPSLSLDLKADGTFIEAVLPTLLDIAWLSGKGGFTASLSGSGRTEQEIIGTLKGEVSLSLADGTISGPDLGAMLSAVSQRILQGWSDGKPGRTPFSLFNATARVADGIASIGEARLESKALTLPVKGEVDLLRRAVDLSAAPGIVASDGQRAAFPVPIVVRGPWDSPRLYPDLPDILANPKTAYENLRAMGLPASN